MKRSFGILASAIATVVMLGACQKEQINRQDDIVRFVGGTSCSDAVCQILSDVLGRPVEVIEHPELVGCYGALTLARLALGLSPDIAHACSRRAIRNIYTPSDSAHAIYQDCYARFLKVYDCAKKMSR